MGNRKMECASTIDMIRYLRQLDIITGNAVTLDQAKRPSDEMIDHWARTAALGDPEAREIAIWAIRVCALAAGIVPASIQGLYIACADKKWGNRTVPAMNLRGWSYNTIRAVFRAAKELNSHLFIFEQSVTETQFAEQRPVEYTAAALAAALREGHVGPVFMQADHDQVNANAYKDNPEKEIARLKKIMKEQIEADFFNIDIDASTVVDLSLPTVEDQQRLNAELTALFTDYVRVHEPKGITISLGAEIGEVGHHNTTAEELRAFMSVYPKALAKGGKNTAGVSKISVNSGTYHGGKVQPDGTLAPVNVEYSVLNTISSICKQDYRMAGAVQHGASTLRGDQLAKMPENGAVEVHLALGFNNLIFDHPSLPPSIKDEIRDYTFKNHSHERVSGETDAQFLYNVRKKAWKIMKRRFWDLPEEVQSNVMDSLQKMFHDMFVWMNVGNTVELVATHTDAPRIVPPVPLVLLHHIKGNP